MNELDPKTTTTTTPDTSGKRRLHPLVATAAGAVIVASLAATAAITTCTNRFYRSTVRRWSATSRLSFTRRLLGKEQGAEAQV